MPVALRHTTPAEGMNEGLAAGDSHLRLAEFWAQRRPARHPQAPRARLLPPSLACLESYRCHRALQKTSHGLHWVSLVIFGFRFHRFLLYSYFPSAYSEFNFLFFFWFSKVET